MTCHGYYIFLDFVLDIPINATCSFLTTQSVSVYIMHLERQFPSSGHLDGCLQIACRSIGTDDFLFMYYLCINVA